MTPEQAGLVFVDAEAHADEELFGAADEDLARGSQMDDLVAVVNDFIAYFAKLTESLPIRYEMTSCEVLS